MDRNASDKITTRMPIVAHEAVGGVDCRGCIIKAVEGRNVELWHRVRVRGRRRAD